MTGPLDNLKVAILVEDGFEQSELEQPKMALEQAGANVSIVSPQKEKITGWQMQDWGKPINVDYQLETVRPDEFDALLLPGGVMNPDKLRMRPNAVAFVRHFVEVGKPVASICHGPWMLVEADAVRGRTVTSWPSLQTDIRNAGGQWVDQEVVVDGNLVTSRKPDDIPAFNEKMLALFAQRKPALSLT